MAQSCLFFQKLPAELRNAVYELAFESNAQSTKQPIELSKAKLPSHALLLTCRQAYREGLEIHKQAVIDYWATESFHVQTFRTLDNMPFQPLAYHIKSLKQAHVNLITKMGVTVTFETVTAMFQHPRDREYQTFRLLDTRGAWEVRVSRWPETQCIWLQKTLEGGLRNARRFDLEALEEVLLTELEGSKAFPSMIEQLEWVLQPQIR